MSGNYFSTKERNRNPSINSCDANRSICVSNCVINGVPRYFWWLYTLYVLIDASTDAYEEEEEVYEEEEKEHCTNCANCTNQGKLIPMQALLVQDSKDTLAIYFI